MRKSFWAFIDPLLGEGNPLAIRSFTYVTYLLALIPFLEIIRNELLVNLVLVKERSSDTIEDLLDPKVFVFLFDNKEYWEKECLKLDDPQLKANFEQLLSKISSKSNMNDLFELILDKNKVKKVGRNFAVIWNQYDIRYMDVSISNNHNHI
jgi:hypothetical protein